MPSIRDLKKDINFVLGDIIEAVYIWEAGSGNKESEEGSVIIDKAIDAFDELMNKLHQKDVENNKAHFTEIRKDLEVKATELVEQLNSLA
ncbi:hypothetical protein [Flagellimonas zhangzhouensis]|uniref:Uncharacterized protein n=1 Tax=Flagellimonas zhangzhouensis TaxID=1073328 RepID=A0A1H2ZB63_9FLAO|nr:hypothetical protein [Allomuricauda zhangzhouensis]SDR08660.1 hypothetical protein SAMN05216294_3398 [Allomuricauda zhangzhouensis]SDX14557.1 hypothetical protein SAMN04487892_3393 [Allomuricauda zhangzhouensis]